MIFKYEIQNHLLEEGEIDVNSLFENDKKYELPDQDGILICGFYMDGGKWDHVEETIKDTPHRFNQLPHFLCKLIIKVFFFKNAQALLNSSNKTDLFY